VGVGLGVICECTGDFLRNIGNEIILHYCNMKNRGMNVHLRGLQLDIVS